MGLISSRSKPKTVVVEGPPPGGVGPSGTSPPGYPYHAAPPYPVQPLHPPFPPVATHQPYSNLYTPPQPARAAVPPGTGFGFVVPQKPTPMRSKRVAVESAAGRSRIISGNMCNYGVPSYPVAQQFPPGFEPYAYSPVQQQCQPAPVLNYLPAYPQLSQYPPGQQPSQPVQLPNNLPPCSPLEKKINEKDVDECKPCCDTAKVDKETEDKQTGEESDDKDTDTPEKKVRSVGTGVTKKRPKAHKMRAPKRKKRKEIKKSREPQSSESESSDTDSDDRTTKVLVCADGNQCPACLQPTPPKKAKNRTQFCAVPFQVPQGFCQIPAGSSQDWMRGFNQGLNCPGVNRVGIQRASPSQNSSFEIPNSPLTPVLCPSANINFANAGVGSQMYDFGSMAADACRYCEIITNASSILDKYKVLEEIIDKVASENDDKKPSCGGSCSTQNNHS